MVGNEGTPRCVCSELRKPPEWAPGCISTLVCVLCVHIIFGLFGDKFVINIDKINLTPCLYFLCEYAVQRRLILNLRVFFFYAARQ